MHCYFNNTGSDILFGQISLGKKPSLLLEESSNLVHNGLQLIVRNFFTDITGCDGLQFSFSDNSFISAEYKTFDQLRDYCRRSADPVGRLVLHLCRAHRDQNIIWSDSICTGLQLANFWQDVARDFQIGRIYLPQEDYERFGYRREDFNFQRINPAFLDLMKFEVDRARQFLVDGLPLIEHLPGRLQVDIDLFAHGGLRILERIESIGYRVWEKRPKVTKFDAIGLLSGALWRKFFRRANADVVASK